jgi:hypothetical protein
MVDLINNMRFQEEVMLLRPKTHIYHLEVKDADPNLPRREEVDKVLPRLPFRHFFLLPTTFTEERTCPINTRINVHLEKEVVHLDAVEPQRDKFPNIGVFTSKEFVNIYYKYNYNYNRYNHEY